MKEAGIISVQDATRIIDSGAIFSFSVVTFDDQRKKGGEIMSFPEARKHTIRERASTNLEKRTQIKVPTKFIRPVIIYQNGSPTSIVKSIHPPLLLEFNGKKVVQ